MKEFMAVLAILLGFCAIIVTSFAGKIPDPARDGNVATATESANARFSVLQSFKASEEQALDGASNDGLLARDRITRQCYLFVDLASHEQHTKRYSMVEAYCPSESVADERVQAE